MLCIALQTKKDVAFEPMLTTKISRNVGPSPDRGRTHHPQVDPSAVFAAQVFLPKVFRDVDPSSQ